MKGDVAMSEVLADVVDKGVVFRVLGSANGGLKGYDLKRWPRARVFQRQVEQVHTRSPLRQERLVGSLQCLEK
jgi:hypothetical protein